MLPDEVEAYREQEEAREWLRRGYTTAAEVEALHKRIAAKRGAAAANRLRDVMREQWARRAEWLHRR